MSKMTKIRRKGQEEILGFVIIVVIWMASVVPQELALCVKRNRPVSRSTKLAW